MSRTLLRIVAACAVIAVHPGVEAQSRDFSNADPPVYLALGDSLPFGWFDGVEVPRNPNWFVGYPAFLAGTLDLPVIDAACPSEASGSFLLASEPDDGCRAFRERYPLHVAYGGTQVDFAASFVAVHTRTRLVTLQLGANDLQLVLKGCAGDVAYVARTLPEALPRIALNVGTGVGALRLAGYSGQVVVVGYYNPTHDPAYGVAVQALSPRPSPGPPPPWGSTSWISTSRSRRGQTRLAGTLVTRG